MTDADLSDLADRGFQDHRGQLHAIALRMLGSGHEADDAVQETWLRLRRSDAEAIDNLGGWLRTVVTRICLDMLRARESRRELPAEAAAQRPTGTTPEEELVLADTVGAALLVVLDALSPEQRIAFVLHDVFAVPFDEIAAIVGCSPAAARQAASRARRRVRSAPADPAGSPAAGREVVATFLVAARDGDFAGLLALLDPGVVMRIDAVAVDMAQARRAAGADAPQLRDRMHGPDAIARLFCGGARVMRRALIDGAPGLAWAPGGRPRAVFVLRVAAGRICEIEQIADPRRLTGLDVVVLGA